ncbi:hypothetical protein B0F87_106300 [Methylobacter tundripaludum]|uniref:Uncharacterized protein n=1 Tax=Methylobacter tundripaludum TaxID=173365 RepID=A0A2S6HDH8_9GAMM|nr:hypothetical protein [Methylobacter tundripaludum]PPK75451.1 hypothetical protein B0F87_106300 [Methylobacter tundripaludum]
MNILNQILLQSSLMLFWSGSVVGVLVGVAMLLKPEQLMRLNQQASRWVCTEKIAVQFDCRRRVEPFIYRHHRLMGSAVLIGAVFVLHTFLFRYNLRFISTLIPKNYWWLSDALVTMLLIGSVLAALIGGIVLTKPSLLRDIETSANRWICTEHVSSWINSKHHFIEQFFFRYHRFFGALILTASLYVLVVLRYYLFCETGGWESL